MGAAPALIPAITEPFAKTPYRQATWPSAARKVYACLMYYCYAWSIKDGRITISDRVGSQWCSMYFEGTRYGPTGRRCWQKGLQQLELLGVISRHRQSGGRSITIHVKHPGPQPKAPPRPRAKPAPAKAPPQAWAAPPPARPAQAPAPAVTAEPAEDPSPDPQTQAFWADFRARQARAQARAKPKLTPAEAQAEMERRRAAARARFGTNKDQPGTPPAPSAP